MRTLHFCTAKGKVFQRPTLINVTVPGRNWTLFGCIFRLYYCIRTSAKGRAHKHWVDARIPDMSMQRVWISALQWFKRGGAIKIRNILFLPGTATYVGVSDQLKILRLSDGGGDDDDDDDCQFVNAHTPNFRNHNCRHGFPLTHFTLLHWISLLKQVMPFAQKLHVMLPHAPHNSEFIVFCYCICTKFLVIRLKKWCGRWSETLSVWQNPQVVTTLLALSIVSCVVILF